MKLNKGLFYLVFALFSLHCVSFVHCQEDGFDWSKERQKYQYPSTGKPRLPNAQPAEIPQMNKEVSSTKNQGSSELIIPKETLRKRRNVTVGGSGNVSGGASSHNSHHNEKQIEAYRNGELQSKTELGDESPTEYSGEKSTTSEDDELLEKVDIKEPEEMPELDEEKTTFEPSGVFGKLLLALLLIGLLVWGLYYWFMNRKLVNQDKTPSADVKNPESMTLSELERMLEQAKREGNFRGAVRVYFTFILKGLITNQWIQWKEDKTNYHYLYELGTRPESSTFSQCVRIYEQVWYGEYPLSQQQFLQIEPLFKAFHKQVSQHT